jgi:hypothetical protein
MTMSFLLIAGREAAEEPLTICIQLTLGTRGNFGMVLSVKSCGNVGLVARCQGVPKEADLRR